MGSILAGAAALVVGGALAVGTMMTVVTANQDESPEPIEHSVVQYGSED